MTGRGILDGAAGVILDLEGTIYRGDLAIPGAVRAVASLRERGLAVRFLTNTTSMGRAALTRKLAGLGFEIQEREVYGAPAVAADFLRGRGESAWLLLPEAARGDFDGVRLDESAPDWIVIGDIGEAWSFDLLNRAFRLVQEGETRLMALVRSRFWRGRDGLLLDAGPFVVALEYATGQAALTLGKPAPEVFATVVASMGLEPGAVVMVGDDPETDVEAAIAAGLRGALVLTGKVEAAPAGWDRDAGRIVLRSVADLA